MIDWYEYFVERVNARGITFQISWIPADDIEISQNEVEGLERRLLHEGEKGGEVLGSRICILENEKVYVDMSRDYYGNSRLLNAGCDVAFSLHSWSETGKMTHIGYALYESVAVIEIAEQKPEGFDKIPIEQRFEAYEQEDKKGREDAKRIGADRVDPKKIIEHFLDKFVELTK